MKHQSKVCIIGVGYVGEHLLNTFSKKYDVIGIDVSWSRIIALKSKYKDVKFQTTYDGLEDYNVFLISVPTLIKDNDVDMSYIIGVKESLKNIIKPGSLLMVESSVYVGGTREYFSDFLDNGIYVGFSPERVDPGRESPAINEIPKVVSGLNKDSLDACMNIYKNVFNTIVPVSSCECAEMCKLYENCFRMVNIAYVNEISDMCNKIGINTNEMINASSTKPFGFLPFYPGLGVGGHCIPVNPYYLFKSGELPVLKYSTKLMEDRPKQKAVEIIDKYNPESILIVGVGFKNGESLLTNSPGYSLYKELLRLNKRVTVYDTNVQDNYMKTEIEFLSKCDFNLYNLNKNFDVIVVNLKMKDDEEIILNKYSKMGGNLHRF